MKSKRKAGSAGRRERRAFSTEFKAEAVRMAAERRAVGGTSAEVGRELDVRAAMPRPTHPYISTREGPVCLATVLDLGSRRCVGWAMRDTMDVDLVLSALRMARDARRPAPGLIFQADSRKSIGVGRVPGGGGGVQDAGEHERDRQLL